MVNFRKLTENKNLNFEVKQITLNKFKKIMSQIKPTPSSGIDTISTKTIKNILPPLIQPIHNLINSIIKSSKYPKILKKANIIPILKKDKQPNNPLSYIGVNLLPSLAKIVDKIINIQLIQHLVSNDLIIHQHNGGIRGKSTMSAVLTMLDEWTYSLEQGVDSAVIVLDQSAVFNVVWHPTLIKKLEAIGSSYQTIKLFKSYLQDRTQQVSVDSFLSEELHIGPMSVYQGSTLSGLFYLIYTLDYPLIHHEKRLPIQQYIEDNKPKIQTFINDSINTIKLSDNNTNNNKIIKETLNNVNKYMQANSLVLNTDKMKILVITDNNDIRKAISIEVDNQDKPITPIRNFTYLGIDIQDNLKWNYFVEESPNNLLKSLQKRLSAKSLIRHLISFKTTKTLLNGLFHSKLLYGAPLWAGAPKYLIAKVQRLQLSACRTAIGPKSYRWSTMKLLQAMKWSSVTDLLERATMSVVHDIINKGVPEIITFKILGDSRDTIVHQQVQINQIPSPDQNLSPSPRLIRRSDPNPSPGPSNNPSPSPDINPTHRPTRLTGPSRIGSRPRNVRRTKLTKYHF